MHWHMCEMCFHVKHSDPPFASEMEALRVSQTQPEYRGKSDLIRADSCCSSWGLGDPIGSAALLGANYYPIKYRHLSIEPSASARVFHAMKTTDTLQDSEETAADSRQSFLNLQHGGNSFPMSLWLQSRWTFGRSKSFDVREQPPVSQQVGCPMNGPRAVLWIGCDRLLGSGQSCPPEW